MITGRVRGEIIPLVYRQSSLDLFIKLLVSCLMSLLSFSERSIEVLFDLWRSLWCLPVQKSLSQPEVFLHLFAMWNFFKQLKHSLVFLILFHLSSRLRSMNIGQVAMSWFPVHIGHLICECKNWDEMLKTNSNFRKWFREL